LRLIRCIAKHKVMYNITFVIGSQANNIGNDQNTIKKMLNCSANISFTQQ